MRRTYHWTVANVVSATVADVALVAHGWRLLGAAQQLRELRYLVGAEAVLGGWRRCDLDVGARVGHGVRRGRR